MEAPREVLEWLYERAEKKSDYELDLSNVLDVKGGILLAVITVFASDPLRVFVSASSAIWPKALEFVFGAVLSLAAILAVCELWPREYRTDPTPSENAGWVADLTKHFEQYRVEGMGIGDSVRTQAMVAMLERLRERVSGNNALNRSKIWCLSWSFRFVASSMAVYVISALALKGA
jgi:hypothetical protein